MTTVKDGVVKTKAAAAGDTMVRVQAKDMALVQDAGVDIVGPAVDITVVGTSGANDVTILDWRATSKEMMVSRRGSRR